MTSPAATRGRPRGAESTEAILDAAAELLYEVGYDDLRMQHVADRARVGLATIYRRWQTKPDLFADAVRRTDPFDPDLDARADLGPALLNYRTQFLGEIVDPDAAGAEAVELMLRPSPR